MEWLFFLGLGLLVCIVIIINLRDSRKTKEYARKVSDRYLKFFRQIENNSFYHALNYYDFDEKYGCITNVQRDDLIAQRKRVIWMGKVFSVTALKNDRKKYMISVQTDDVFGLFCAVLKGGTLPPTMLNFDDIVIIDGMLVEGKGIVWKLEDALVLDYIHKEEKL